jgi:sucrose phosphorylase
MLQHGNKSKFKDFFYQLNEFWEGKWTKNEDGIIPKPEFSINYPESQVYPY